MRVRELQLRRFGRFTDEELTFASDGEASSPPGLHVVYGANEAGKTTTLHAIRYGLYGIPDLRNDPRTYDFLHRKRDLRIAMVVESAAGEQIAFTQRKRKGDSWFDITDTDPAPDLQEKVARLLEGVDRDLFTHKYGIDRETLRAGGAGLAGDANELGESLFAAATGIVGVRATLDTLASQIDELLRSTGRAGKIHDAVKRYESARAAAEDARRAGRACAPKQLEIERAQAALDAKGAAVHSASVELERAASVAEAIEHVVQRSLLLEEIDELGVVIDGWSADLEEQRRSLRSAIATSEASLRTARSELGARRDQHAAQTAALDQSVLGASERAGRMRERIAEYLGALEQRSRLAAALEDAQARVATACEAIRPGTDPEQARTLIPTLADLEAARVLLEHRTELDREAGSAAAALGESETALLSFEAEQPAEPEPEPAGLEAVETALNQIETVDTSLLAELDQRLELRARQLDDAAAAIPRCSHAKEQLLALQAPLEPTVDAFAERLREARSALGELEDSVADLQRTLGATDAEIAQKSAGRDLPSVAELETLRGARERLWRRIRAAWAGESSSDDAAIEPGGEEAALAEFEDAVEAADAHADRLVRAGELVGTIAALEESRVAIAEEIAQAEDRLAAARSDLQSVESEWQALWEEIDVEPGSPSEMRAWLAELKSVRELAASMESESVNARGLRARVERVRRDLSAALTAVGRPPAAENISVEILEATARELLDTARRAREEAATRDAERRRLEGDRERARARGSAASEGLAAWSEQWEGIAPALGLAAGALPEAGSAMLEAIEALDEELRGLAEARRANEANDLVVTTFETDVAELASAIGAETQKRVAGKPADQAVREIVDAVGTSERAAAALEQMTPQIEDLERRVREHQDTIAASGAALEDLAATAGLADGEELDAAAARWSERERLSAEIRGLDQTIVEITKMRPADVVAYLGDTPPDDLPAVIAERQAAVEAVTQERDELSDALGALQQELGELQADARVEPHLAEIDDARAEIERLAAEYVPLKLQHELLTSYLREKASEHMGPSMKRAGAIFSQLTCGAYGGVAQDVDEANRQVLSVVAGDGRPNVDRSALSTGTRDQLYLALRLASVYEHLDADGSEPIPFVVDDILTTFDDERSAATMRVLAELATRTQVLFFTHNQHLVELARKEVPAELLRVHTLG